jgi:uncharacterized protein (TIGR02594 family)
MTSEPAWLTKARSYLGFHETGDNQGIDQLVQMAHCGANGEPWCAIFVNAMLESSGIRGTRSPAAASFTESPLFRRLEGPQLGCLCTFTRPGGNHVAFYTGSDSSGRLLILGGNQSDSVCIEAHSTDTLTGFWWPVQDTSQADVGAGFKPAPTLSRMTGIIATVFGGSSDPNTSAYDGHRITNSELGVALPYHFSGTRPKVRVYANGRSVDCTICDVGPWNTNDPYWTTHSRPEAESGTDNSGRRTNHAGIDLTPAAAAALGIDGKGTVDWEFITESTMSDTTAAQSGAPAATLPMAFPQIDMSTFLNFIQQRDKDARNVLTSGVAVFNALHPDAPIVLSNASAPAPATAPPPAPAPTPVLQRPSVQLGAFGVAISAVLQALGLVGMPIGGGATQVGTLATLVPSLIAGIGATGGWASIGKGIASAFTAILAAPK